LYGEEGQQEYLAGEKVCDAPAGLFLVGDVVLNEFDENGKAVSLEENGGKLFPAYEAILKAVNDAFCDELKPGEEIISSTKYEDDIIALKNSRWNNPSVPNVE
jgi:hypothetical protein